MSRVRFDLAPLHGYLARRAGLTVEEYPLAQVARDLDVCPSTPTKWQHKGLPTVAADRAAVRLGFHPSALWPEWWDTAALEPEPKEQAA